MRGPGQSRGPGEREGHGVFTGCAWGLGWRALRVCVCGVCVVSVRVSWGGWVSGVCVGGWG